MNDNHNPYTPPSVSVRDVQPAEGGKRPVAVVIAVVLISSCVLYNELRLPRMWDDFNRGWVPGYALLLNVAWVVLFGVLCVQLWRGRNWARIVLALLAALDLMALSEQLWSILHRSSPGTMMQYVSAKTWFSILSSPLSNLAAVVLVFVPGRAWFVRRRADQAS